MFKKILKAFLILLVFLLVIPYLIPTDYSKIAPVKPTTHSVFYTTSDGVTLHTEVFQPGGEEKGKILLIHGLMASTFSYRNNVTALSDAGYTVIAVDLPGFGYSDKPKDKAYTQVNYAKWIWEMLKDFDAESGDASPWHLVGHSMGGSTALAMALQDASSISDITLIDGAVTQGSNSTGWLMRSPVGAWLKVALRYFMLNEDNFRKLLTDVYQKEVPQEAIDGYLAPVLTKGTINGLIRFVQTSKNVTIDQVKDLNLKINLLWGGKDTWVPIEAMAEINATVTIHQSYIFPNAGHTPHETESDFNTILLGMLE